MEIDADKLIEDCLRDGIREGIKSKMTASYNNPLDAIVSAAITAQGAGIRQLIGDAIASCMGDETFRATIVEQTRHVLAKQLVQKFGGELEKQVNMLKSDPSTRARITLAIEDIVANKK